MQFLMPSKYDILSNLIRQYKNTNNRDKLDKPYENNNYQGRRDIAYNYSAYLMVWLPLATTSCLFNSLTNLRGLWDPGPVSTLMKFCPLFHFFQSISTITTAETGPTWKSIGSGSVGTLTTISYLRELWSPVLYSHSSHWNGFSPECWRTCRRRLAFRADCR